MTTNIQDNIIALFKKWTKEEVFNIQALQQSGSERTYYRISNLGQTVIATHSPNEKEMQAFIQFSKHFSKLNLPVPQLYIYDKAQKIYLQQDLGTTTLYDIVQTSTSFTEQLYIYYKQSLEQLARIQILGHQGLDYSVCYPRAYFDKQSMLWDLNLFKYYFLKLAHISFDEQKLENDFHAFAEFLMQANSNFFLFRDFQSRNIMITNSQPYFIDYQGGRQGPLQYDVVSLLFQAKAQIPHNIKSSLLEDYIDAAQNYTNLDRANFKYYYYPFVYMRTMQVLGAYGYRGLYERKPHFIESIPYAISNLKWLLATHPLPIDTPELKSALTELSQTSTFGFKPSNTNKTNLLTVRINSFSYKKGIPEDNSSNGGGFVFDCRFLHNPGRYKPYKTLTGRDAEVIQFLNKKSNIQSFIHNITQIVDKAVENYIERDFTHLTINFGCTGGQHRSVYTADQIAQHIHKKYGVKIIITHRERGWESEVLV